MLFRSPLLGLSSSCRHCRGKAQERGQPTSPCRRCWKEGRGLGGRGRGAGSRHCHGVVVSRGEVAIRNQLAPCDITTTTPSCPHRLARQFAMPKHTVKDRFYADCEIYCLTYVYILLNRIFSFPGTCKLYVFTRLTRCRHYA